MSGLIGKLKMQREQKSYFATDKHFRELDPGIMVILTVAVAVIWLLFCAMHFRIWPI